MSNRKPFNGCAGYVASRRNLVNRGWAVIYKAAEAGLDASGGSWVCVCETHGTICNFHSLKKARAALAYVDWCEECMTLTSGAE